MNKQGKAKPKSKKSAQDSRVEELTADLQRVQADFVNYKRREAENDELKRTQAKASVIQNLLPFIDNIERALSHIPKDLEDHEYVKGIQSVAKQLQDFLDKLGVEKVQTVGAEFDPEFMDAVAMEDNGGDKEVVTEELQSGYVIGSTVLRHAMVKVKKG